MNVDTIRSAASKLGIPSEAIAINGPGAGECYVIERADEGWSVYYSERGSRVSEQQFSTEAAACRYLIGWLVDDVLALD